MARPLKADGARTQARILAVAAELFAERGPDAVSIRELAAAAGLSVAMINHYFGSKEALYQATVDAMYAELAALRPGLMEATSRGEGLQAAVNAAIDVGYRFARAHRPALRFVMRDVLATGEVPAERKEAFLFPLLEALESLLAPRTAARRRALRLSGQSVLYLINRYALASEAELQAIIGGPRASAETLTHQVIEHLQAIAALLLLEESP
ncbi:MAG: helix-turn-helix domain-containing protein [Myxococcota bacterium]